MAKFRIMAERIIYTPFFKVFEADTVEEAERLAAAEVEGLSMLQELDQIGWEEGDPSVEYELRPDTTTEEPDGR